MAVADIAPCARSTLRTSHQLLPAMRAADARITPQSTASCELRMSSPVSPDFGGALARSARTRGAPIATISSAPVSTPASSAGSAASRSPFCSTTIVASPMMVPGMVPRPPVMAVPPSTTAVTAIELVARAGVGLGLPEVRDVDDSGQRGQDA